MNARNDVYFIEMGNVVTVIPSDQSNVAPQRRMKFSYCLGPKQNTL
jgi:hypothetical protein